MLMSTTWQQTLEYNPNDPTQRNRVVYAPGGYTSYYWNRVPDAGVLNGLGAGLSAMPTAVQVGLVALAAGVVGFFGYRQFGGPVMKKLGIGQKKGRR